MTDDQRLSPAERDRILFRVDEAVKDIPKIKDHLKEINGTVRDTCVKIARNEEIAKDARETASSNRKYIDKIIIAVIAASVAACAAVASAIIQVMSG